MTGRRSWFHPADRVLATINSVFTVVSAFWAIAWWQVLLLVVATFSSYGVSVFCIRKRHFEGYVWAHTCWHVIGSMSMLYVMGNGCGWQTSFAPTCVPKRLGMLYCNCL